mmetsp:Transcript_86874/g.241790  ORF Transcript_86874/g.241790 Transcript_86874/m.241790 type:complete len:206 (-) Transcript_86874:55-672(-)
MVRAAGRRPGAADGAQPPRLSPREHCRCCGGRRGDLGGRAWLARRRRGSTPPSLGALPAHRFSAVGFATSLAPAAPGLLADGPSRRSSPPEGAPQASARGPTAPSAAVAHAPRRARAQGGGGAHTNLPCLGRCAGVLRRSPTPVSASPFASAVLSGFCAYGASEAVFLCSRSLEWHSDALFCGRFRRGYVLLCSSARDLLRRSHP